ncbi:MAG TPA: DsbA family protein [Longimicrobium sp.]|jgi:protein-disulfide isomerase|uniref:DsbA family protein n=1 Tax=Longimicrobium sp. TaxID=2029185 RepID=UPI002EDB2032
MKNFLSNALTGVLVVCAVIVTGLLVRREFGGSKSTSPVIAVDSVANWKEVAATGSIIGSPDAPLKIVEFSDFQCPSCAQSRIALEAIRAEHPDIVALVYRHFPLTDIHAHALPAAIAAECAGEQDRFGAYHDALFQHQDSIGAKPWRRYAEEVGVKDLTAFEKCVQAERPRARIASDMALGQGLSVSGTPTFIFRERMVSGTTSIPMLAEWVREAAQDIQ